MPKPNGPSPRRIVEVVTGEPREIERLIRGSERGRWKSNCKGNSLAAYSTASTVLKASGGGDPFAEPNTKAFHRLAARIKKAFPRLPIVLLLDGLYPNGPVMARCRQYHWDFMIVLKNGSLPTVWQEYLSLVHFQQENQGLVAPHEPQARAAARRILPLDVLGTLL